MFEHKHTWDPNKHYLEAGRDSQTVLQCQSKDNRGSLCNAKIILGDHLSVLGYEQNERALRVNRKMFWVAVIACLGSIMSAAVALIALLQNN